MSKKYLVMVWRKSKNIALYYVDNIKKLRTIRALHKDAVVEVADMEPYEDCKEISVERKREPVVERKPWATRVRCIETGEEWESMAECQRKTGMTLFALTTACRTGKAAGSFHYRYVI